MKLKRTIWAETIPFRFDHTYRLLPISGGKPYVDEIAIKGRFINIDHQWVNGIVQGLVMVVTDDADYFSFTSAISTTPIAIMKKQITLLRFHKMRIGTPFLIASN